MTLPPRTSAKQPAAARMPRAWLWRLFWVLMVVGHAPAWVASFEAWGQAPDRYNVWRWALLTASQLFFLLKTLDVAWLRLPRRSHALLVSIILFTLLHADVVRHWAVVDGVAEPVAYAWLAVGAAAVAVRDLRAVRRTISRARSRAARAQTRARQMLWLAYEDGALVRPGLLLVEPASRGDRAPPT